MTLRKTVANALSFAHLAGISSRMKAEDDAPEKKDDDKARKARRAEDDEPDKKDQDQEDGNVKKGKRAQEQEDEDQADDDSFDAEDGDEDEDKKAKSKARGAKADDEDAEEDDDEEEMSGKSAAAQARRRERARCAAIFGSKAAARNPSLAANLAFNTRMTRSEALTVLENTAVSAPSGHGDRASRNPSIGGGGSTQGNSKHAIASGWDNAFAKVSPRR